MREIYVEAEGPHISSLSWTRGNGTAYFVRDDGVGIHPPMPTPIRRFPATSCRGLILQGRALA